MCEDLDASKLHGVRLVTPACTQKHHFSRVPSWSFPLLFSILNQFLRRDTSKQCNKKTLGYDIRRQANRNCLSKGCTITAL